MEKREEGHRGDQRGEDRGSKVERPVQPVISSLGALHSSEHPERFTEIRREEVVEGEAEVTWGREGRVRRGESNQAINHTRVKVDIKDFTLTGTKCVSRSVVSDSLQPHQLYSPWNFLGQNTGVGSFSFLQRIFLTKGLNPGLPHCRRILYQLSHKGNPSILEWVAYPFPTQELNQGLLHCRQILYQLSYQGSPRRELGEPKSSARDQPCTVRRAAPFESHTPSLSG